MENFNSFKVETTVNTRLEEVWDLIYNRFGETALFNPNIEHSQFVTGLKGEVGCERVCNLDPKTFVREQIVSANPQKSFTVDIVDSNMPMVEKMLVTLHLIPAGEKTNVSITANYITKPAFMGTMVKGMFKKMLLKVLIGLKYHLETGNAVSKATFKPIFKQYQKLNLSQSFTE